MKDFSEVFAARKECVQLIQSTVLLCGNKAVRLRLISRLLSALRAPVQPSLSRCYAQKKGEIIKITILKKTTLFPIVSGPID